MFKLYFLLILFTWTVKVGHNGGPYVIFKYGVSVNKNEW